MPAKCPKCGELLEHLNAYSLEENRQEVELTKSAATGDVTLDWGLIETVEDSCTKIDFECPNCSAILYTNDGNSLDPKIVAILQGEA